MEIQSQAEKVAVVASINDPIRRSLFEFVSHSDQPVGRDAAAEALGMARSTAAFHLDKLVEEGALDVEFKRISGKTGPGSGRPAKLYCLRAGEIVVSIPERHYELVGSVLAAAIGESDRTGETDRRSAQPRRRATPGANWANRPAPSRRSSNRPDTTPSRTARADWFCSIARSTAWWTTIPTSSAPPISACCRARRRDRATAPTTSCSTRAKGTAACASPRAGNAQEVHS